MEETKKIRTFLTKTYNNDNSVPFAWINTEYKKLSDEGIEDLQKYINIKRIYQKNDNCNRS